VTTGSRRGLLVAVAATAAAALFGTDSAARPRPALPSSAAAPGVSLAPSSQRTISREQLVEAMRASQGFDPTATPNGARLQAEVLLRLVREYSARDPGGAPLFIASADWYFALLERCGLPPERAPLYARLAYENRQDTRIEYGIERVLDVRTAEPRPLAAANVWIGWPDAPGARKSYSYDDLFSTPTLRVTCERSLSYRLVDFGDMVLYGDVRGLRGRPTSGALAVIFDVIGEASVVENRMAIAGDGTQVSRGSGRKGPFSTTVTVTLLPSGTANKGIPPGRPDLAAIEERLKRPVKVLFLPWEPATP
jgi:hypothetical protein